MSLDDDTKLGDLNTDGDDSSDGGNSHATADADADAADAAAADVPDGLSSFDEDDDMMLVDTSASCEHCAHKGVCAVYGNFKEQVEGQIPQRTGGEPAFEVEELALICDYFEDERSETGGDA